MKKQNWYLILIVLLGTSCSGENHIKNLINTNLKSRCTNFEIVSITQDSCPNMNNLFNLSLSLKLVASECKLNISKATLRYTTREITLDETTELCKKEVDKIAALEKSWANAYFSRSEKCLLVKYNRNWQKPYKTRVSMKYDFLEYNWNNFCC